MAEKRKRIREKVEKGIYREQTSKGVRYIAYAYSTKKTTCVGSFASLTDARRAKKTADGTITTKGDAYLATSGKRQTFGPYALGWLEFRQREGQKKLSPSTARVYRVILNRYLIPALGRYRLADLTLMVMQDTFTALVERGCRGQFRGKDGTKVRRPKPMSPKYARNMLQLLRALTKDMAKHHLIPEDFGKNLAGPTIRKTPIQVPPVETVVNIITRLREPYRTAAFLALFIGPRQGETLALMWPDFDIQKREVHIQRSRDQLTGQVRPPKTAAGDRIVRLPPEVIAFLLAYRERQREGKPLKRPPYDGPYLFPAMRTRTSKYPDRLPVIDPGRLRAAFTTAARAVLADRKVRWHDLRHLFASAALASGGKEALATISHAMGHANPGVTLQLYSHMIPSDQATVLGAVSSSVMGLDAFRQAHPIPEHIPAATRASRKRKKTVS